MSHEQSKGEALLVLDAELNVRAANKAFYELFRLAPEECIGHRVYAFGGPAWDNKLRAMLEAVLDGGPRSDQFGLIREEGAPGQTALWVSAKALPASPSGERTLLLSIQDLSASRTTQESLESAVAELKTLADATGKVAHQLNNVLTVIRMNAELLQGDLEKLRVPIQETTAIIAAVERAEALSRQLLVSSRRALPQTTGLDRPEAESESLESDEEWRPSTDITGATWGRERTGRETILLVEDESELRTLQKRILTAAGYHVIEAADGAQALRLAATNVGEIDLVLTDVEMPTLGGRGMVDELKEIMPGTKVLFMSGYTDNEILRRGIRTGETQFLKKPFTAEELKAAVGAALRE